MSFQIKSSTPLMQFTDDDVNKILAKYDRNLNIVQEDIDAVKKWIGEQKHLSVVTPDRQIFIFLVMSKFSIEKTKEKLDMYYSIRTLIPDYYNNLMPSLKQSREMQKIINLATLPKLSRNLNRVMVYRIVDSKNSNFSSFALHVYVLHIVEIKSVFDVSCSDEYVCDLKNLTLPMVTKYSLMDIKKIVTIIEKVFSNRIAAIHFINLPSYAETLVALAKSCMKEKIRNRFHYHTNYETLYNFYSKEMLPKDFGGDEKSIADLHADWIKFLDEQENYFVNRQKFKVNEALRAKKLSNDDILGFHGNFRKLAVD